MNYSNEQPNSNDTTNTPDWLEPAVPTPQRGRHLRKISPRFMILTVGIIAIAAGTILSLIAPTNSSESDCFNADNYSKLAETIYQFESDSLEAQAAEVNIPYYIHSIYFLTDSLDFDTDLGEDPTSFLKAVGQNYKDYNDTAPFSINIGSSYADNSDLTIVNNRAVLLKNILIEAGVDEAAIMNETPTIETLNDDSIASDDYYDEVFPVRVSITPISRCSST